MILHIDFETYSEVDIYAAGAWVYSTHPSTGIHCMAYALGDRPVCLWLPGEDTSFLHEVVADKTIRVCAHNAFFERSIWANVLSKQFGVPVIPRSRWSCTAAKAALLGLPRKLEDVARVMNLKHQKNLEGAKVMKRVCTRRDGHNPADMISLYRYCKQDVEVERELDNVLPDLSNDEKKVWVVDQFLNDNGVNIDADLLDKAQSFIDIEKERLDQRLIEASNGELNAKSSRVPVMTWCKKRGVVLPDFQKATLQGLLLKKDLPQDVAQVLFLRTQLGLTSLAKYGTMRMCLEHQKDTRIRETLMYSGAGPGRWSGKITQFQNLPRPTIAGFDADLCAYLIKQVGIDGLRMAYDDQTLEALSNSLRSAIVAPKGKDLIWGDYAAIEARVVMWLADDTHGISLFQRKDAGEDVDIYKDMAATIYGIPYEQVTKAQRQLGKQAILGCVAKGTVVYSDTGSILIETLREGQKIWDGAEWVSFKEVVRTGIKNVTRIGDVWLTPDHLVLSKSGWRTAGEIVLGGDTLRRELALVSEISQYSRTNFAKALNAWSLSAAYVGIRKMFEWINSLSEKPECALSVHKVLKDNSEEPPENIILSFLIRAYENGGIPVGTIFGVDVSTQITKTLAGMALAEFKYPSSHAENFWNILLRWISMTSGGIPWIELIMPKGTKKEIFELLHKEKTTATKEIDCYDIVGCKNYSFAAGDIIAHNCGYGMGHVKFKMTCDKYNIDVTEVLAKRAIESYRATHAPVTALWGKYEAAFASAVNGKTTTINRCTFTLEKINGIKFVSITLPSGRKLWYYEPGYDVLGKLEYWYVDGTTKKWVKGSTYGGHITENITQAVARDIMAEALVRMLELKTAFTPVLTVHDEIICEVEKHKAIEEVFLSLMTQQPTWAPGLPIAAECWVNERYRKT